jgi:methyl-accepting chemotaxis protein
VTASGVTSLRGVCVALGASVLAVFTLLAVLVVPLHGFRQRDRARDEALAEARAVATFLDGELRARIDGLAAAGAAAAASRGVPGIELQVRSLQRTFPDLTHLAVLDERGAVVTGTDTGRADPLPESLRTRAAARPVVGAPRRKGAAGLTASLWVPIRARDGALQGFVAAEVALDGDRGLLPRLGRGADATAEILTPAGAIPVSDPSRLRSRPTVRGVPLSELVRREWVGELQAERGDWRYVGVVPVRAAGWTVAAARPTGGIGAGLFRLMTWALAGAAVALALGIALGLLLIRRPAAALRQIGAGLRRLAADDIPSNVSVTTHGEVGALSDTFNRTLDWLRQSLGHQRALSRVEDAASAAISGDRSVPETLTDVLRQIVTGMDGDVGIAFLREGQDLVSRGSVGLWGVPADGLVVRRGGTFTRSVLARRAVECILDTEADGRADEPHVVAAGLRSIIAAPMLGRGEAIGVVEVGYRTPRSFTAAETERLEVMTRRLVQAVEQVRALEAAPELPARLAILRRRAALEGLVLAEDVALLIAREVPASIRELEGAFTRLVAFADLTERELTLELAREFFERTRVAGDDGRAASTAPARPAPFLAIVRRGATELFDALKDSLEEPGVVEVMWDRRVGPRRRREQSRARDRRRGDRRRPASIAQAGQDYLLVRRLA